MSDVTPQPEALAAAGTLRGALTAAQFVAHAQICQFHSAEAPITDLLCLGFRRWQLSCKLIRIKRQQSDEIARRSIDQNRHHA